MRNRDLASMIFFVLAATSTLPHSTAFADDQDKMPRKADLIFSIGKEDNADFEFRIGKWRGIQEYDCHVALDCSDDSFPAELAIPGKFDSYGVVRLRIFFDLERSYEHTVLRLVRGGDETTVIKVDGQKTYEVTSSMLGSGEGFNIGAYELDIGSLQTGSHSFEFTVLQDGKGNGGFQWDALSLFGI